MEIINKEKLLEHAKKLVGEGKFDKAIEEYKKILDLDPDDLRVKIKMAELFVKRKQIQDAIKLYTEVAQSYTNGGFYLKAATVYKNMLRINPSLIDINIALSELYEKMGLMQDALYQYQIVITHYEQKGDASSALALREKMAEIDPDNTSLKIRLAETYQMQGEMDKSIDIYESIAAKIKNRGKNDQLIEIYNKILAHRPEKHDLLKELCQIYYKRGDLKEILKKMDGAKEFVALEPGLLQMQAEIYARLNQIETAKGKYRDLSLLLKERGDIDGALKAYDMILFLSPEDEEDIKKEVEEIMPGSFGEIKKRVDEKRARIQEEETKKIEEDSEPKTPEMKPEGPPSKIEEDSKISYNLGNMYKQMGLLSEAKREYEKALAGYKAVGVSDKVKEIEGFLGISEERGRVVQEKKKVEEKKTPKETKINSKDKKKISFV